MMRDAKLTFAEMRRTSLSVAYLARSTFPNMRAEAVQTVADKPLNQVVVQLSNRPISVLSLCTPNEWKLQQNLFFSTGS